MRYGVGIVGCGWVAGEYIKAFKKDPRSEVRALISRTPERPQHYREQYELDCTVGADHTKMLEDERIKIVVVATPHDLHTRFVVDAAAAGKHIIIEKPVAMTLEDVRAQQEAVKKAGVKTVISFVLRWNPLLMTIDKLIGEGAFGNVFMVEADYMHRIWSGPKHWLGTKAQGGSSIIAGGCHAVDAMRCFARSEVAEVCAYYTQTENPNEYPGTINVAVRFEDGKTGRTTSCFDAKMPYVFHVGVYGTEGSVRDDRVFAPRLFPGQTGFMTIPTILPDSGDVAHHPFQTEVQYFLDCLEQNVRPLPDLEDAAKTMEVCFAADKSAAEGKPVAIKDL